MNVPLERFLHTVSGRLRCRLIRFGGQPYLERYYVATVFGMRVYLHRFVASDPDRGLHDHPWSWAVSWILAGRYDEVRADPLARPRARARVVTRRAGRINRIRGTNFHRILLPRDVRECWTLFVHGPRVKGWGFWRDRAFEPFIDGVGHHETREWWRTAPRGFEVADRMPPGAGERRPATRPPRRRKI